MVHFIPHLSSFISCPLSAVSYVILFVIFGNYQSSVWAEVFLHVQWHNQNFDGSLWTFPVVCHSDYVQVPESSKERKVVAWKQTDVTYWASSFVMTFPDMSLSATADAAGS